MRKLFTFIIAILFAARVFAQPQTIKDEAAIHIVLNAFMQSIMKKDTVTLSSLFATNIPIGWIDVQDAATLAAAKKDDPAAVAIETGNYKDFIRFIGKTKKPVEEKFTKVKIRTDGLLASVSFDYSFWGDNKKENWGQENWELVYNGTDWKIAGVYFSYKLQSVTQHP